MRICRHIKNKKVLLTVLVITNIAVGFLGYKVYKNYVQKYDVQLANGRIEVSSLSDLRKQVQEQSEESKMNIQLNVKPSFTSSGEKGDLFISNSYDNKQDVQVEIYVKDSNKLVLKTDKIKPGSTIPEAGLQEKLSSGDYKAVAKVQFLNNDGDVEAENQVDMLLQVKS